MAVTMLVFVHILANVAVSYDIRQNLERKLYKNSKSMYVDEEDQIAFVWQEEEIYFLVLNCSTGEVLAGEYPKGCPTDISIGGREFQEVTQGRETFFIWDIRKRLDNNRTVCVRGIVRKSDIYSRYRTLEYLACLSILLVSGAAILSGIVFARRISNSLKGMCRLAGKIGMDTNMSKRMEYHGRIYELMVLTQANNRMLDRLEEMFCQQEQFTSDVAHELRTPVAVITAECQYARAKSESMEDYQEAFEVIDRHSGKINMIISRLLELSRLDSHRRQIQREEIDLPEIVQSVCEDMQQKANDTLSLRLELAEARTVGDIGLIMIGVQNLLTNALKYSPAGSVIEVATGTTQEMVFVSVRDYGEGIREEDMEHIFKRFYKADKSRNSEGFGLGLPLTMKIAQKHGGTVTVDSVLGEGSAFMLLLPVCALEQGLPVF